MNEMTIRLDKNGAAAVPGGQLLLGYAGNRGNYRLRIEQRCKCSPACGKRRSGGSGGGDGRARCGLHHL